SRPTSRHRYRQNRSQPPKHDRLPSHSAAAPANTLTSWTTFSPTLVFSFSLAVLCDFTNPPSPDKMRGFAGAWARRSGTAMHHFETTHATRYPRGSHGRARDRHRRPGRVVYL